MRKSYIPDTHVPTRTGVFWSQIQLETWYLQPTLKQESDLSKTIKELQIEVPTGYIETKPHLNHLVGLLNNWDWQLELPRANDWALHCSEEDIVLTASSGFALAVPSQICQWISSGRWACNEVVWLSHYSSPSANTTTEKSLYSPCF